MSRAAALHTVAPGLLACALLAGCAAPGDPTPPRPVIPVAVTDLAARQAGDTVALTFNVPRQSTEREPLAEPPAIEIYRAPLPPGALAGPKTSWRLVYAIPSERVDSYLKGERLEFHDPLTVEELGRAPGSLLAYMVRTREAKRRASDDSNFVTVPTYPAPAAPVDLRAAVTERAIALSWNTPSLPESISVAGTRIYRAEFNSESEAQASSHDLPRLDLQLVSGLIAPGPSPEFRDSRFEFGKTYIYVARTVARFGPDLVESADSLPSIVTPRDIFPPAVPLGLEAAGIPATPQTPAYVELTWAMSPEADLAGYRVYRSEREDTQGERIGPALLPSPAFRDNSLTAGKVYFYRVSAVDRYGNESPLSPPARIEVPLREP
jgi:hypothetical protein